MKTIAIIALLASAVSAADYPTIKPTPVAGINAVATAVSGSHWSHPRTIQDHLRLEHGVNPAGMTQEQMLTLHDSIHEGRKVVRQQTYSYQYGGCPGGICPLPQRRRR